MKSVNSLKCDYPIACISLEHAILSCKGTFPPIPMRSVHSKGTKMTDMTPRNFYNETYRLLRKTAYHARSKDNFGLVLATDSLARLQSESFISSAARKAYRAGQDSYVQRDFIVTPKSNRLEKAYADYRLRKAWLSSDSWMHKA